MMKIKGGAESTSLAYIHKYVQLCPVLGFPVQKRKETTGQGPVEGYEED